MARIELVPVSDGHLVRIAEGESEPATRGLIDNKSFDNIRRVLGQMTHEMVVSLEPLKQETKEITMEMAFELTSGLDLKIVDLKGAATIKLTMKI